MKKLYESKLYQTVVMLFIACMLGSLMTSCVAIQPAVVEEVTITSHSLLSVASYWVDDLYNPTQIYGVFTWQSIPYHFVAKVAEGKVIFEQFGRTSSDFIRGFVPLLKQEGYVYSTWNTLPQKIQQIVISMGGTSGLVQFLIAFGTGSMFTPLVIPADLFSIDASLFPQQNF